MRGLQNLALALMAIATLAFLLADLVEGLKHSSAALLKVLGA